MRTKVGWHQDAVNGSYIADTEGSVVYGPLLRAHGNCQRGPGLGAAALVARLPRHPEATNDSRLFPDNRVFLRTLNNALKALIPPIARRWGISSDVRYGMMVCDVYLMSYVDGRDKSPPLTIAPTLSVIYHPTHECPIKVRRCAATPQAIAEAEALATKLQEFLGGSGSRTEADGYSLRIR